MDATQIVSRGISQCTAKSIQSTVADVANRMSRATDAMTEIIQTRKKYVRAHLSLKKVVVRAHRCTIPAKFLLQIS